ncbi:PilZ domain-containing protein [Thiogranum longum]|uniref:PilZ domain-containing protein n=1 Tax=Thiogranum longum TaxID=1537524 RepID=UPI001401C061|nr:PilZ domain-containing protein [Thiogranum longum]
MDNDKRRFVRTELDSEVKLMHSEMGSISVRTRDISGGGVYLLTGDKVNYPVGTEFTLQAMDMAGEAPLVKAVIVRLEPDGIALQFYED